MRMLVPDVSVAAVKDVDENYPADIEAERVPEWLSQVKADAYREDIKDGDVLLTAAAEPGFPGGSRCIMGFWTGRFLVSRSMNRRPAAC